MFHRPTAAWMVVVTTVLFIFALSSASAGSFSSLDHGTIFKQELEILSKKYVQTVMRTLKQFYDDSGSKHAQELYLSDTKIRDVRANKVYRLLVELHVDLCLELDSDSSLGQSLPLNQIVSAASTGLSQEALLLKEDLRKYTSTGSLPSYHNPSFLKTIFVEPLLSQSYRRKRFEEMLLASVHVLEEIILFFQPHIQTNTSMPSEVISGSKLMSTLSEASHTLPTQTTLSIQTSDSPSMCSQGSEEDGHHRFLSWLPDVRSTYHVISSIALGYCILAAARQVPIVDSAIHFRAQSRPRADRKLFPTHAAVSLRTIIVEFCRMWHEDPKQAAPKTATSVRQLAREIPYLQETLGTYLDSESSDTDYQDLLDEHKAVRVLAKNIKKTRGLVEQAKLLTEWTPSEVIERREEREEAVQSLLRAFFEFWNEFKKVDDPQSGWRKK